MTESDREEQKMKVVKFGGSSMADAGQYRKVRDILLADPERRVVVVSAAGKRFGNDHKLTDLLYLCYAHVQYGVDCSSIFDMIASRYLDIRDELGLDLALEPELDALKKRIDAKEVTQEELVSRGEYFSAKLMAAYLGFQFVDAADWVMFNMDGTVNRETSYKALRNQVLLGYGAVIPGFYGAMPDGAAATSPARWRRRRWTRMCTKTGRTYPASSWPTPGSWTILRPSPRSPTMSFGS